MTYCHRVFLALTLAAVLPFAHAEDHHHGHGGEAEHAKAEKGPRGGRLLREGDFTLEVTIFEKGAPPEFRVYPSTGGKPIPPALVSITMSLKRFDKEEKHSLVPREDYLVSRGSVEEPHSFEVDVNSIYQTRTYSWKYESFEGRTEIETGALKNTGVEIAEAGPATIKEEIRIYGQLRPNTDRLLHVRPRFPGVVKEVRKTLGDSVKAGDTLAILESDQSLARYELKALIDGTVTERHATLGEHVSESNELFVVSDLSEIWADFQVYLPEDDEVHTGKSVNVQLGEMQIPGKIVYISPYADEATQSKLIRVLLSNVDGKLRPGLFVTGSLMANEIEVPVAVTRDAVQRFRDWSVVFLTDGHVFQAMPVELGRKDSQHIEIREGISAGSKYVSARSFLIKADIEKSGASHDH